MKVIDCINLINALQAVKDLEVPATTAYKFSRNVEILAPIVKSYEERRAKVLNDANPPKDGRPNTDPLTTEQILKINEELNPILDTEEEVSLKKIKISDLVDVKITSITMAGLSPMIEDE